MNITLRTKILLLLFAISCSSVNSAQSPENHKLINNKLTPKTVDHIRKENSTQHIATVTTSPKQSNAIYISKRYVYGATGSIVILFCLLLITFRHYKRLLLCNLQKHKKQYHILFNSINDAMFIHDIKTGQILDVNDKMLEVFGYTKDEVLDSSVDNLSAGYAPYDQKNAIKKVKQAVAGKPQTFEWHAKKKSGELFWIEGNIRCTELECKQVALVAFADITSRKKTEEELLRSELRFFNIIYSCPIGVYLYEVRNDQLILLDSNPAAEEFTNTHGQNLTGKPIEEAFPAIKGSSLIQHFFNAAVNGISWKKKNLCYKTGKQQVVFDVYAFQTSPGRMAVMLLDVTEREKSQQRLQKSEEKYRRLIETASDGIAIFQKERIIDCNQTFASYFDMTITEIKDKSPIDLSPEMQPSGQSSYRASSDIMRKSSQGVLQRYEWTCKKKTGDLFELDISLNSMKIDDELVLISFSRDITDRKKLEEQLRQAQKMESVGKLAGGIAHDFNNMLAGIIGATQLLSKKLPDADKTIQRYIRMIEEAANKTSDLTQKLLAFSRKGHQQNVLLNVSDLINQVVSILEHTIDKRISLITTFHETPLYVKGDPAMLQNAILNLAINAKDALPDGGVILISTQPYDHNENSELTLQSDSYIQIDIQDNGSGISPQIINHIFEPFFTTKEVGKGTGMGLAAAYGTIENHKGTIAVTSQLGKGTLFTIYLPLCSSSSTKDNISAAQDADDISAITEAILIVDDEPIVRDASSEMLDMAGYRIYTANCGQEALRIYSDKKDKIDLVILDVVMPDTNGIELYEKMAEITPAMKVIFASGYNAENTGTQRLQSKKGISFIQKPFKYNELVSAVKTAINQPGNEKQKD